MNQERKYKLNRVEYLQQSTLMLHVQTQLGLYSHTKVCMTSCDLVRMEILE